MAETGAMILAATARTAIGRSRLASAAAVRAGLARLEADPLLRDDRDLPLVTARATWLPAEWPTIDRVVALARPAAFEALSCLRRGDKCAVRAFVGVAAASRDGRIAGLDDAVMRLVEQAAARTGRLEEIELVRSDHASGLFALASALKRINSHGDLCLVGGVDSWLDEDTIAALASDDRVKTPRQPFGFMPGEASAFVLLGRPGAIDLPALATVHACATAIERAPVNVGHALSACFGAVMDRLPSGARVDRLVGDLNGEPARADELGMTLVRCGARVGRDPDLVMSPAKAWGDVGAASAPLGMGLAVASIERRWGADRTLVWASSPSGERGAAIVARADI